MVVVRLLLILNNSVEAAVTYKAPQSSSQRTRTSSLTRWGLRVALGHDRCLHISELSVVRLRGPNQPESRVSALSCFGKSATECSARENVQLQQTTTSATSQPVIPSHADTNNSVAERVRGRDHPRTGQLPSIYLWRRSLYLSRWPSLWP